MRNLTERQEKYVINRAAGMKQREAAVAAGFSAATADRQASALEKRADIKSAINKARRAMKAEGVDVETEAEARTRMPKAKYTDSMEFLLDAMNHKHLPIPARAEYAKSLLPYQHARIGETGKKQTAKERAAAIARGGKSDTKPKFATKAPPPLRVVK